MDNQLLRDLIWNRAKVVEGYDANQRRKDIAGAWIEWDQFETEDEYGWRVYPLIPLSKGGSIDWMSLIPLHWQNAQSRGENFPYYTTTISSKDDTNIRMEKHWNFLKELNHD